MRDFLLMLVAGFLISLTLIVTASALGSPPPPRRAHPARYVKVWICPLDRNGREIRDRRVCLLERWARW